MSLFKKANPYKKGKDTFGQDMNSTDWNKSRNEQFWEGFGPKKIQSYSHGSTKAYVFFVGLALVGITIFLPIWEVDGFKGHREAGWKTVKKYFEKKAADKKGAEYYKNARENLRKLKEEHGIKDTDKSDIKPKTEVVTVKNPIIEKYRNDSEGWREKIANEKGLPISYISDIIDSQTYLSKENIKKSNSILKPYSIDILRDAGDVLDRNIKYNPKSVIKE
jgi:hypothetical protein